MSLSTRSHLGVKFNSCVVIFCLWWYGCSKNGYGLVMNGCGKHCAGWESIGAVTVGSLGRGGVHICWMVVVLVCSLLMNGWRCRWCSGGVGRRSLVVWKFVLIWGCAVILKVLCWFNGPVKVDIWLLLIAVVGCWSTVFVTVCLLVLPEGGLVMSGTLVVLDLHCLVMWLIDVCGCRM